jgi:ribosomal protein L11 methyltransferase
MWLIKCSVDKSNLDVFIPILDPFATSISFFEQNSRVWYLEAMCEMEPDLSTLTDQFEAFAEANHITCPLLVITKLPERDWLTENYKAFPAIQVGSFFIHGSHIKENCPSEKIALQINAATAFGSGEHATTNGCLIALEALKTVFTPWTALDIGCGSGILAIATAKLWPTSNILAIDNDQEAIHVAQVNCKINQVNSQVTCILSEGFKELEVQKFFDLITANILADPLILMANDIFHWLNIKGFVILSGILTTQIEKVLTTYQSQGFDLYEKYLKDDWAILILQKLKS